MACDSLEWRAERRQGVLRLITLGRRVFSAGRKALCSLLASLCYFNMRVCSEREGRCELVNTILGQMYMQTVFV